MRWLVDECVDAGLVESLRASGHDVIYTAEIAPSASDTAVLARAQDEKRLLLTDDKDFGELVIRRKQDVPGVVLLRIDPAMHDLKIRQLATAIERLGENLFGRYTIVEAARVRSRPLRK